MALMANSSGDIRLEASNASIAAKIAEVFKDKRVGIAVHISQHVVAQKKLNTGYNLCYLTETGRGMRRLYLPRDEVHPSRNMPNIKKRPDPDEMPNNFRHLLEWYKTECEKQSMVIQKTDQPTLMPDVDKLPKEKANKSGSFKNKVSLKEFVQYFEVSLGYFYSSKESFSEFQKGPCIYFHKKAVGLWKMLIKERKLAYESALDDVQYVESIYSVLTAWGMHMLGGGPKLKDFKEFKIELLKIAEDLDVVRNTRIEDFESVQGVVVNYLISSIPRAMKETWLRKQRYYTI